MALPSYRAVSLSDGDFFSEPSVRQKPSPSSGAWWYATRRASRFVFPGCADVASLYGWNAWIPAACATSAGGRWDALASAGSTWSLLVYQTWFWQHTLHIPTWSPHSSRRCTSISTTGCYWGSVWTILGRDRPCGSWPVDGKMVWENIGRCHPTKLEDRIHNP